MDWRIWAWISAAIMVASISWTVTTETKSNNELRIKAMEYGYEKSGWGEFVKKEQKKEETTNSFVEDTIKSLEDSKEDLKKDIKDTEDRISELEAQKSRLLRLQEELTNE